MKKRYAFIILLLVFFFSFGCNNAPVSEQESTIISSENVSKEDFHDIDSFSYDFSYPLFEVKVDYPEFPEYSKEVNRLIKEEAFSVPYHYYGQELYSSSDNLLLSISYEVKLKTDNFISIVFRGTGHNKGSTSANYVFYTLNLDLQTMKKVRLPDRVVIDDALMDSLIEKIKGTLGPQLNYMFGDSESSELQAHLLDSDTAPEGIFSYYTTTAVGICFPVPHAYFETEVPIDEVTLIWAQLW